MEGVIEEIFLNLILQFSLEDLKQAVKNNVNLLNEAKLHEPNLLLFAKNVATFFGNYKDELNLNNILSWLKLRRRDFWEYLTKDEKAKMWLEIQISNFKSFLFT